MKEMIAQVFPSVMGGAVLACTIWLGTTAVTLSNNSASQTVLIQSLTNQVNALVLDVAMIESDLDTSKEFMLLHPTTVHRGAATTEDFNNLIRALERINERKEGEEGVEGE